MAKAYYVKNETPAELVSPILEALRVAAQTGKSEKVLTKQPKQLKEELVN